MKSKLGLLSVAFAAASMLLGPANASANDGWWGRGGYGYGRGPGFKVRNLQACVDDYAGALLVRFVIPGSAGRWGIDVVEVATSVWGAALCDDRRGHDGWYGGPGGPGPFGGFDHGGFIGYGPFPGSGPGCHDCSPPVLVPIDNYCPDVEPAFREHGSVFYTAFDLLPLGIDACGPGYLEDIYIDRAEITIDGLRFILRDVPLCGDDWYSGWN